MSVLPHSPDVLRSLSFLNCVERQYGLGMETMGPANLDWRSAQARTPVVAKSFLLGMVALCALYSTAQDSPRLPIQATSTLDNSAGPLAGKDCCLPVPPSVLAWDILRTDIRSHRKTHRTNAIAALAVIGPRADVLNLLEGALRDKDAVVRKTAAVALGDMQALAAKPALRGMLDDESSEVGFAAANALWKMGDHSGREIFIATLSGERRGDGIVKSSLKSNFAKYSDPKNLAMTGVKEAAGAFLGPLPMGITIAQELMKDHTASARAECAALLAKDPSPDAVRELTQALSDRNWAVRAAAAQALAVSPGEVSPDVFKPLLTDDNGTVRDIAAAGTIRLNRTLRPAALRWPVAPAPTTTEAKN